MHKLTTLSLLAAGLLSAGIGSATACSYSGTDVTIDGKGNVLELIDDGFGNQATGRVIGKYNRLRAEMEGDCSVLVVDQRGFGTDVTVDMGGWNERLGVLAADGAAVDVRTDGHDNTILADATDGDVRIRNKGSYNQVFVQTR